MIADPPDPAPELPPDEHDIDANRDVIVRALDKALKSAPIEHVHVVRPSLPPQGVRPTTYLRCTVLVNGRHPQRISADGKLQIIQQRPGEAMLYLPGSWRQALPGGFRTSLVFFFTPHSVRCFCYYMPGRLPSRERAGFITASGLRGADASLVNAVEQYAMMKSPPAFLPSLLHALMERVLEIVSTDTGPTGKSASTFHAIRDYIHEHFRQSLSRDTVAEALRIHPAHVSRLFRTIGDTTFQDYVQHIRVEYACKLLTDPALTFKEVALESGFRDADHFREAFRRERGQSPQEHRSAPLPLDRPH